MISTDMRCLYLFLLTVCCTLVTGAQQTVTPEAVQDSIARQLELFPQEKIHLHTDRAVYVPGERIWFRAYVVDAITHRSPTYSQYAYVELISASDSLVSRVMVSLGENGLFHGHIFLSEFIPEGDYTLRAYTRYMTGEPGRTVQNPVDGYFFKKPVRINNLHAPEKQAQKQSATRHFDRLNDRNPLTMRNYDVSFFPEGGYMAEGVFGTVAFKALNGDGVSEAITGEIVDDAGNGIAEVNTLFAGMGAFAFMPEHGQSYFLNCKNQSGQEKRFQLPTARKAYAIAAGYRNGHHLVEVKKSPDIPEQPLFLLVHCRGTVLYFDAWDHRNTSVSISGELFPSGIIHFILFDGQMNPVGERLVFNRKEDRTRLAFSPDRPAYQQRERVVAEVYLTDADGDPLSGHLSVAVTDDADLAADSLYTIASSLLLSSELRGYIESPGYYLQDSEKAESALDLLMMTHGWRRYDIPEAVRGNYTLPQTEFETVKAISGSVRGNLKGRTVMNSEVSLLSSDGCFDRIDIDSTGLFSFYAHYPDSVTFYVQATNRRGRPNMVLVLDREQFPALKHAPHSPLLASSGTDIKSDASGFIRKAERRAQYDENMRTVQLPEVVVKAKTVSKKDEARLSYWFNKRSDFTVYREDIEKSHPQYFSELLYRVPGVFVKSDGTISIRSGIQGGTALILINGITVDQQDANLLNIHDIESIDVIKGAKANMFGSVGGNGVISITTRRGASNDTYFSNEARHLNDVSFKPLGYQRPVEFYSPRYDTPESKNRKTPDFRTTVFWKPDVVVAADGKATFDFYTSDFPATYSVVIEGLSDDGKIIRQVEKIEVR